MERLPPLITSVQRFAPHFEQARNGLAGPHSMVTSARGGGFMRARELTCYATQVIEGAMARGLLVNRTAEPVVRMLPPLNVTAAEIDEAVSILDGVLATMRAEATA